MSTRSSKKPPTYGGKKSPNYGDKKSPTYGDKKTPNHRDIKSLPKTPFSPSGFYGRRFNPDEAVDLQTLLDDGLQSEINILRVIIRRCFEQACDAEQVADLGDTLGTIGLAVTRLASLLKVQQLLGGDNGKAAESILQAILQASQELQVSL